MINRKWKKQKTNMCQEFGLINSMIQMIWEKQNQNY